MLVKRLASYGRRFLSSLSSRQPIAEVSVDLPEPMRPAADADAAASEELIWTEKAAALAERPQVDLASWAGAFQRDLIISTRLRKLTPAGNPAEAYNFAAVVMMVKDEADIIAENLIWLHRTGVRRYVILDNGSTDQTLEILERFRGVYSDAELITVSDPLLRYMQSEKTTGLYRLAFSVWPDVRWVVPIDADEFLIAGGGLSALDQIERQVDAITIPKVIHFKRRDSAPQGNVMEQMDYCSPMSLVPPKIMLRPNPTAVITQGNHQVRFPDQRPVVYTSGLEHGLYYREFPNRSFEHFLRKVRNGGPAIRAAEQFLGQRVGGWHWVEYYERLVNDGEEHLRRIYEEQYLRGPSDGFSHMQFSVDATELRR